MMTGTCQHHDGENQFCPWDKILGFDRFLCGSSGFHMLEIHVIQLVSFSYIYPRLSRRVVVVFDDMRDDISVLVGSTAE